MLGRKFPITQAKLAELCEKALRASPKVNICPPGQLTDLTKQAHEHGTEAITIHSPQYRKAMAH
jgi:hypothetical protein